MQIRSKLKTTKEETDFDRDLTQELLSAWRELSNLLNGGLKFEDNFNAQIITIADTGAADSENTVAHTLKRVPSGFLLINSNKAGAVYKSGTAWTTTNVYLKFSSANAEIKIILL